MDSIKNIIAENLIALRKKSGMTQSEVAEKLNYSFKSISKWEHADSLPDIEILYNLAKLYGVDLNYLTESVHETKSNNDVRDDKYLKAIKNIRTNRLAIVLISFTVVWLLATIVFGYTVMNGIRPYFWQSFIWAIPISCIVLLRYNRKWGKKLYRTILTSCLIWSLLASVYLQLISKNIWIIFILGIPIQIIIILMGQLSKNNK